jgi:hypothetical protein
MSKSESKTPSDPGGDELVSAEEVPATAVQKQDSRSSPAECGEAILGEDLLAAHLYATAPDSNILLLPMIGLEFREDSYKLYQGLNPKNTPEAIIATVQVALLNASLGCLADARREGTPPDVRDMYLKHGINAATRLADLMERFGTTGSRNIRVGNVNVEAGGQAIVGHVQAGRNRAHKHKTTVRSEKRKRNRKSAPSDIIDV